MEKMIKFRLFHYYEESKTAHDPVTGNPVLVERFASFGQTVDIPRQQDVDRGEALGAFFSDDEVKAIESGAYRGPSYDSLRSNATAALPLGPGAGVSGTDEVNDGELPTPEQVKEMDSEEVAEVIQGSRTDGKKLNIDQTLALAGTDPDAAEKVLDAENLATENDPRDGVVKALERIMSDATTGAHS